MRRHLFLTGPAGIDKSALLRGALAPALGYAGGYITEKSFGEDGALLACTLYPAAAAADLSLWEGYTYLVFSGTDYYKNNDFFRFQAAEWLQEAVNYPFALLDSAGGFELVIPQFRAALTDLLRTDLPVIGVLKCQKEAENEKNLLGIGPRFGELAEQFRDWLAADADTEILEISPGSEAQAREAVRRWAAEYLPFLAGFFSEAR